MTRVVDSLAVGGEAVEDLVGGLVPDEWLVVLDLKLPERSSFELLEQLSRTEALSTLAVIVYTDRELTRRAETRLKKYAETIVVKDARSPERLLDETSLFLHGVEARLPRSGGMC